MLKAMPLFAIVLFASTLDIATAHKGCGFHSELGREFREVRKQHAAETRFMHEKLKQIRRDRLSGLLRLQPTSPQPIRFHVSYQIDNLEASKKNVLRDKVLPIALRTLQDRIKVKRPVAGSLTLPVTCTSVYVSGNECAEVLDPTLMTCGHAVPEKEHYGEYEICSYDSFFRFSCSVHKFGDGVPNADFILYVTAVNSGDCGEGTAAFAHHCENDVETNRPLAGTINMCDSFFKSSETLLQQIETVTHEVLHALIFNPDLWSVFIDAEGNSLSKFDVVGENPPAIVSPKALSAARAHFGCKDMTGIPLENQGSAGTAGAHWDSRFLQGELMDPVAGPATLYNRHTISSITLGLIDDSGWYEAVSEKAGYLRWGKDAGCDFLTESCQSYALSHPGQDYFCGNEGVQGCVPGTSAIGQCAGHDETMDGCLVMEPFSNGDCVRGVESSELDNGAASNILLDTVGANSRCLGVEAPLFRGLYGFNSLVLPYRCYKLFCIDQDLYLEIGDVSARCFSGQMVDLAERFGSLDYSEGKIGPCPDNAQACASLSCPSHCSSKGRCVDGTCNCFLGFSGPACASQLCNVDVNCPEFETCQDGVCGGEGDASSPSSKSELRQGGGSTDPPSPPPPQQTQLKPDDDGPDPVPPSSPVQEQEQEKLVLQVLTELETSKPYFETNVKTVYTRSVARAASVDIARVKVVSALAKQVPLENLPSRRRLTSVEHDTNTGSASGEYETLDHSRGLKQREVVEVETHVEGSGGPDAEAELSDMEVRVASNWETSVVVDLRSVGVEVLKGTIAIIAVEGEQETEEEKDGSSIELFGQIFPTMYLFSGAGAIVFFFVICCCCCKKWCRDAKRQENFSNVSGTSSRPPNSSDQLAHPKFSSYAQPLRMEAGVYDMEMSSSPLRQAAEVDASGVSVSLGSYRPEGNPAPPARSFYNVPNSQSDGVLR
ncbi:hypothetical protein BSKO_01032 [Bryopsis sp. KO-2023]|nr:hypothetical protein BSKO_01032 [Bryopsis sp. KO-2023]